MKHFNTFIFISLLTLVLVNIASASSINRHDISPRQMAMGGAFSAQVNTSTSMAINPAGMALKDGTDYDMGEFFMSYTQVPELPVTEQSSTEDVLAFLWAKRYTTWTIGAGLYDRSSIQFEYEEQVGEDTVTKSTQLGAYDISVYLAYAMTEKFKLGGTLKISSLSTEHKDSAGSSIEDEVYSVRLGAKYFVLDTPIDFSSSAMYLAWALAAAYEPKSEFSPFAELAKHPLKDTKITGLPQEFLVGSHLTFGWIFESFSFVLNLNSDLSQANYSGLAELLVPASEYKNIELTKKMLGAELLFNASGSAVTYAMRAGISDQTSNIDDAFDEKMISAGVGVSSKNLFLDLSVQKEVLPETALDNRKAKMNFALALGVSF